MTKMSNIVSDWCDESDCRRTLRRVYDDHGYCVDPHTAVAVNVAERKRTSLDVPVRVLVIVDAFFDFLFKLVTGLTPIQQ